MNRRIALVLLLWLTLGSTRIIESQNPKHESARPRSEILFVCEHGAALSVVSAAYFNKIAREEHLPLHAIARGTNPQKEIAVSARDGLTADGVPFAPRQPQLLSTKDAAHARRIIAFCLLPARYSKLAPSETWPDVPPTGANYGVARDAILEHLRELFRQLMADDAKR